LVGDGTASASDALRSVRARRRYLGGTADPSNAASLPAELARPIPSAHLSRHRCWHSRDAPDSASDDPDCSLGRNPFVAELELSAKPDPRGHANLVCKYLAQTCPITTAKPLAAVGGWAIARALSEPEWWVSHLRCRRYCLAPVSWRLSFQVGMNVK